MKKLLIAIVVMIIAVLLISTPTNLAKASPDVTIEVLNLPSGELVLNVGESRTFDIDITSDSTFILAVAMTDADYPGRGVFWHGIDRASQSNSALLHLTITGKKPTVSLPYGVAPVSIVAGVRFKGGVVYSERFAINVKVE